MSILAMLAVLTLGLCGCNSDDETSPVNSTSLYAVIVQEGAQLIDITPSDYVLTLDNIIAVNPETGEFKLKNTEQIDSKANLQNVIQFYSEDNLLFEAQLNNAISSRLGVGLLFMRYYSDKSGFTRYDLETTRIVNTDGQVIEGNPTAQQDQGMKRMYQILQRAGKISSDIAYDF